GQRLVTRDQRELREAVRAARLLDGQVLRGVELGRGALAVLDADDTGAPPLVQRAGADPECGDGADAGDDDFAAHEARLTTRSIASPTVLILPTSSPLSATPYSSSMIWESSARSSESTARSAKGAVRVIAD